MKRLFAILLVLMLVFSLCACKKDEETSGEDKNDPAKNGSTAIEKLGIPDPDVLSTAWRIADAKEDSPYIIFTTESTVRIVKGSTYLESEISYGIDGRGNKSMATDCSEFKGQSVYTVKDDVLEIKNPVIDEEGNVKEFKTLTYKASDEYSPLDINAKENFKADDSLVGVWTYADTRERYEFTDDGYVICMTEFFNGNYENYVVEGTYTAENGTLTIYTVSYDKSEIVKEFDYSVDGTKLLIGDADYYLNGEGDPSAEVSAE